MKFETYVSSTKNYDMEEVCAELLERIRVAASGTANQNIQFDVLKNAVDKSKGTCYSSRYGLSNDILFADSELISAFEANEYCVEYLQYRYDFKYYPIKYKLKSFPLVVAVEAASACNLRCHMCFQSNMDTQIEAQNKGILSYEIYQKFLNELEDHTLYSIVFASRGEPLLNPHIAQMISDAKKCGVLDIKLNTNATLLTEKLSRKLLESGLDLIVFSVDSISPENYHSIRGVQLKTVIDNIEGFLRIKRDEFPNSTMKVRVAMVLTRIMEPEADDEIKKAKDFWLERVDELSVKSEADFVQVYETQREEVALNKCRLLWERLYLWYDGRVNPCDIDHLSTLCVGDISHGETISSIWNGDKMNLLRQEHLERREVMNCVCSSCTGY